MHSPAPCRCFMRRRPVSTSVMEAGTARLPHLRRLLPWTVVGRDGSEITFDTRGEWFAAWRRRIRAIEGAPHGLLKTAGVSSPLRSTPKVDILFLSKRRCRKKIVLKLAHLIV